MTIPTRWKKLIRDFDAIQGRVIIAVVAMALGVFGVSLIGTAYLILTREVSSNYLATNPASAIFDFDAVDSGIIQDVLSRPEISQAEATSIVTARVELRRDEWVPILLFVIPDFNKLHVNKVAPVSGDWPPPTGTILLEREALKFIGRALGDRIDIQLASGRKTSVAVSGSVHDPALAPAWQEQTAYGYVTPETFAGMGGNPVPELLKVVVKDAVHDQERVDDAVTRLAAVLTAKGHAVHQIQVPPTGKHPHQGQMTAVLTLFLVFAVLALVLAAVLVASIVDGLLAQQVRQIAVMKAIGARWRQIAGLYLVGVLIIAFVAISAGLPLGIAAGRSFSAVIGTLLNFEIQSYSISPIVVALLGVGGICVPLAFAFIPINRAANLTVREAISDFGVSSPGGRDWIDALLSRIKGLDRTLLLAIRNAFRQRGRLLLTLLLLACAGGMFIASTSVQTAWTSFVAVAANDRTYDLELQLDRYVDSRSLMSLVSAVPGVAKVEPWSFTSAALARQDGLTVIRTYPDGGHASIDFRSLPSIARLGHLVKLRGALPSPNESDALVVNQGAWAQLGRPEIGESVALTVAGKTSSYRLAAVVRQIVTLPSVYVSEAAYQNATGTHGTANAVRIAAVDRSVEAVNLLSKQIEASLLASSTHVAKSISEARMGSAVGGHVRILVVSLISMSILMASVGLLGLASAQGISVAERTREFGIMRTIGGTNGVVVRNILAEGIFIGLLSFIAAILLSLPLTMGIGNLVGTMSFGLPLPLMLSTTGMMIWIAILVCGSACASLVPAFRASRLTIRETLARI